MTNFWLVVKELKADILFCVSHGVCDVSVSDSVLIGDDQSLLLLVSATNDGEGAYETELVVQLPEHTHFQSCQVRWSHTH